MNPTRLIARLTALLKTFSYGEHIKPLRDWMVIMAVSFALLIGCAGWSYWVFVSIAHGTKAAALQAAKPVNTASLETVRTIFEKRAAERAHYLSDYHFVDPSK